MARGTVTDDGTVESIQYIFRRQKRSEQCWNGAWTNNCMFVDAKRAGTRWSVPGFFNDPYASRSGYTYSLTIKATDSQGFVTERAMTFTMR